MASKQCAFATPHFPSRRSAVPAPEPRHGSAQCSVAPACRSSEQAPQRPLPARVGSAARPPTADLRIGSSWRQSLTSPTGRAAWRRRAHGEGRTRMARQAPPCAIDFAQRSDRQIDHEFKTWRAQSPARRWRDRRLDFAAVPGNSAAARLQQGIVGRAEPRIASLRSILA